MAALKAKHRIWLVDAVRGLAVIAMIVYHFCFDLNYFQLIHQDFNGSLLWLTARAVIVTVFLTLVGVSLVLAARQDRRAFWVRIAKLLAASAAVTLGSYLMFPQSFIFFGILHFILVASLIGRLALRYYWPNLVMGGAIVWFGIFFSDPWFDQPWLQWIGLMTYKPVTEDYVPLFPWLGVVLIGIFLGKSFFQAPPGLALPIGKITRQGPPPVTPWIKLPAWIGKHSLAIYLLHQPLLIGMLYLFFGH